MIKQSYEIDELNRVVKFVDAIEKASVATGVRVDALDGIYLVVDNKDTNLHLHYDEGDPYSVSPMVSM